MSVMKKKFNHLSYEERVVIHTLKKRGFSIRAIARELGRSPNSVSYELKEKKVKDVYIPKKAHHKSYVRRYLSKRDCLKVSMNGELTQFVIEKLKKGWSPERMAGYLRRQEIYVSKSSVYRFIHSRSLEYLLFSRVHKKRCGRKRRKVLKTLDGRQFIEKRPVCVSSGHYEADFIVSSHSTWCLLVVVDRYTRHTTVKRIRNRKHTTVSHVFSEMFRDKVVKTLTLDNDIAFNGWKQLPYDIYFTHPYCSWEKGLVENTNRWIRLFVKKKRDISTVTKKELDSIHMYLNEIPRQCLGFRTATEVAALTERVS